MLVAAGGLESVPEPAREAYAGREVIVVRATAGLATKFDVVDSERLGAVELRKDALLARLREWFEREWERADPLDGHATDVENE